MYKLLYLASRNPSVAVEDWPRTWRSHAVFASQFPVMEAELRSLFYCCRIVEPTLDGEPVDLPEVSTAQDGIAVVASPNLSMLADSLVSAEDQVKIDVDEHRVFGMLVKENIAFTCEENVLKEGREGKVALFRGLTRKAGLSHEEFLARWNGAHGEIEKTFLAGADSVTRYVHNERIVDPPKLYKFDGIAEMWFATPEDAVRSLADGSQDAIVGDLAEFCDMAQSVTLLTRVCHSWVQG